MQAIVLVVLVVLVVAQVTLTLRVTRLRSRVGRFERDHGALSRTVATVQGWAEQQLRAVRGEFAVARVNDSADRVRELRAKKRPAAAAPPAVQAEEDPEDTRDTLAAQRSTIPMKQAPEQAREPSATTAAPRKRAQPRGDIVDPWGGEP